MAPESKKYPELNLKPHYVYGLPILLFLGTVGAVALVIVGIYECFL